MSAHHRPTLSTLSLRFPSPRTLLLTRPLSCWVLFWRLAPSRTWTLCPSSSPWSRSSTAWTRPTWVPLTALSPFWVHSAMLVLSVLPRTFSTFWIPPWRRSVLLPSRLSARCATQTSPQRLPLTLTTASSCSRISWRTRPTLRSRPTLSWLSPWVSPVTSWTRLRALLATRTQSSRRAPRSVPSGAMPPLVCTVPPHSTLRCTNTALPSWRSATMAAWPRLPPVATLVVWTCTSTLSASVCSQGSTILRTRTCTSVVSAPRMSSPPRAPNAARPRCGTGRSSSSRPLSLSAPCPCQSPLS
mmetsp:Transcript_21154/g.49594  ORF Transcript_21154/g.49594 Transcript_21154/m.49594 type:complete len:300 (+) Transcript_21154:1330-2229(+)